MAADLSITSPSIGTYAAPRSQPLRRDGKDASGSGKDIAEGKGQGGSTDTVTLSDAAQQQVQKLKQADTSVRQHEAAHQAAGGSNAGGASFTFTRGPDGKNYATAGEVPIDVSPESEPAATVAKMEQVKAAALAPADPSPQDLRVAAQADAAKLQAQSEQRRQGGDTASGRAAAAYGAAQALGNSAGAGRGLTV
ncbi:putative metalloprotease CJM1_0395 family protein [Azospirillum sp. Sh1]|uniref:putative metalloprotease CJM1_0395 family protein n=1 Tax=Azospirillum sp. Sh1 TaxID=2607285 RepID=UPI001FFF4E84|nr:putative metalloprotease CJM1_0395 family protein [Azospirillum sp. Sh1]